MGNAAPLVNLETVGCGCGASPDNCRRLPPAPPYARQGGDDERKRRGDRTRGRRGDDSERANPDRRRRRVRRRRGDGRCGANRPRIRGAPDARAAPRIPHRRGLRRSVWSRGRARRRGVRETPGEFDDGASDPARQGDGSPVCAGSKEAGRGRIPRLSIQDDRKLPLRYDRGSLRMGADA